MAWTRAQRAHQIQQQQQQQQPPTHTHRLSLSVCGCAATHTLGNTHLISANVRHLQSYARHSICQSGKGEGRKGNEKRLSTVSQPLAGRDSTEELRDGRTDRETDRQAEGRTDRQTPERIHRTH